MNQKLLNPYYKVNKESIYIDWSGKECTDTPKALYKGIISITIFLHELNMCFRIINKTEEQLIVKVELENVFSFYPLKFSDTQNYTVQN